MSVELNLDALAVWMRDIGEPVTGELSGTRVGQGQSNLTYRIDDEAGTFLDCPPAPAGPAARLGA